VTTPDPDQKMPPATSIGAAPPDRRAEVARALIRWLNRRGEPYAVLGITDRIPDAVTTDLDLVMREADRGTFERDLLAFGDAIGAPLIQRVRYSAEGVAYALAWIDPEGRPGLLGIDVCGDVCRGARVLMTAEELLAERTRLLDVNGEPRGFNVPSPAFAFAHMLLKGIGKQRLGPEHARYLSARFHEAPAEACALLADHLPRSHIELVIRAAKADDWREVVAALAPMRRAVRGKCRPGIAALVGEMRRLATRLWRPAGLMLAVLGPDGSGKSAVLERINGDWAIAFRRIERHHLRPRRRPPVEAAATRPHGRPPRGVVGSLAKLAWLALAYQAGYHVSVRPALVRHGGVVFDRYAHDLAVDPHRFRYGGPMALARAVVATVPAPDLVLVLDAPPEVLLARKRELPQEELERQREAYRRLAAAHDGMVMIDASRPFDEVAAAVHGAIRDTLCRRVREEIERR
jgi:thymidylate kinase